MGLFYPEKLCSNYYKMKVFLILSSLLLLASHESRANGYEGLTRASARHSALGGAAGPITRGAEALLFNPAGLTKGTSRGEIIFSYSPTLSRSRGPAPTANNTSAPMFNNTHDRGSFPEKETKWFLTNPFSLLLGQRLNRNLAFGMGISTAGEEKVHFHDALHFYLNIHEFTGGFAYAFSPYFSMGLAWRTLKASGNIALTKINSTNINEEVYLDNLRSSLTHGVRLGFQVINKKRNWGGSFTMRTSLSLDMTSPFEGTIYNPIGEISRERKRGTEGDLRTTFPDRYSLGAFWRPSRGHTLIHETSLTRYGVNKRLNFEATPINFGVEEITPPTIELNWSNRWDIRFGHEIHTTIQRSPITLRYGYAYSTSVVSRENAHPLFSPPGGFHTMTAGMGKRLFKNTLALDLALQYSIAPSQEGYVEIYKKSIPSPDKPLTYFERDIVAVHATLKYRF